ncbi:MAG: hypothetical protein ACXWWD_05365 [Chitinophagaceae bacterium]
MKQYHTHAPGKRIATILLFLSLNNFSYAQENQFPDTIKELKYQLDTAIIPGEQPADSTDENFYVDETTDEPQVEQEFFLRKEFTGGLPDSIKFRRLQDSVIKALRDDKAFWYANESFKKREKKKEKGNLASHPLFQTILWLIIIAGFSTFLILYLSNSNVGLFRKSRDIAEEEADPEASDIFAINYQKEIEKAVGMSNYRLAVRLMFLRLLRNLSDKKIIEYKQDSTNFDYMMQLRSTVMYADFSRLARNYEYSWYGQFDIDKEKYSVIRNEFENFDRKLSR